MTISEDRISNLAHEIVEQLWSDDLADLIDQRLALDRIKLSLTSYFHVADEIEETVRAKLKLKTPGSREWDILYHKYFLEETARRKW